MRRLEGKSAIVTGAGSGIGSAAAIRFAEEGARVVIAELDVTRAAETVEAVRELGGEACFIETDVTQSASAKRCVEGAIQKFGRIDVRLDSAGGSLANDGPVTDVDSGVYDHTMSLDLEGTMLCCRYAIPCSPSAVFGLQGLVSQETYGGAGGSPPEEAEVARRGLLVRSLDIGGAENAA